MGQEASLPLEEASLEAQARAPPSVAHASPTAAAASTTGASASAYASSQASTPQRPGQRAAAGAARMMHAIRGNANQSSIEGFEGRESARAAALGGNLYGTTGSEDSMGNQSFATANSQAYMQQSSANHVQYAQSQSIPPPPPSSVVPSALLSGYPGNSQQLYHQQHNQHHQQQQQQQQSQQSNAYYNTAYYNANNVEGSQYEQGGNESHSAYPDDPYAQQRQQVSAQPIHLQQQQLQQAQYQQQQMQQHPPMAAHMTSTPSPPASGPQVSVMFEKTPSSKRGFLSGRASARGAALVNSVRNLTLTGALRKKDASSVSTSVVNTASTNLTNDWEKQWDEDDSDEEEDITASALHAMAQQPPPPPPPTLQDGQQYAMQQQQHHQQYAMQHQQQQQQQSALPAGMEVGIALQTSTSSMSSYQQYSQPYESNSYMQPTSSSSMVSTQSAISGVDAMSKQSSIQQQSQASNDEWVGQQLSASASDDGLEWDTGMVSPSESGLKPSTQMFPMLRVLGKGSFGKVCVCNVVLVAVLLCYVVSCSVERVLTMVVRVSATTMLLLLLQLLLSLLLSEVILQCRLVAMMVYLVLLRTISSVFMFYKFEVAEPQSLFNFSYLNYSFDLESIFPWLL
jgi:hypothetical protein